MAMLNRPRARSLSLLAAIFKSFLVGLLLASTCVSFERKPARKSDEASRIDDLLRWLPIETETLIVARGPFHVEMAVDEAQPFDIGKALADVPMSLLDANNGMPRKQLLGQEIELAIEGSRHFRAPRGFGMMPFEGCQIIVLKDKGESALKSAMQSLIEGAPKTIVRSGRRVAIFEEELEKEKWTFYFTEARPRILLCATHENYLNEVLRRMDGDGDETKRAFPKDLPEWKYVNLDARFWAIRHYAKPQADKDPTSPQGSQAATDVADPKAVGLVVSYFLAGKHLVVYYLTGADEAVRIAKARWEKPSEMLVPRIAQLELGVVKITTIVKGNDIDQKLFIVLMASLGHAVFL